jgi:hypothetical protein
MMRLETNHQQCLGESCLACETWLFGLQTKYNGNILISDRFAAEMSGKISSAIEICPNGCLALNDIDNAA